MGVWLCIMLMNGLTKWASVRQGILPGNDDYNRLVQVRDWLAGQDFTDLSQYRLYPPDPLQSHWARLPDMLIGGVIKLLTPIVGAETAEYAALLIIPAALLLITLILVAYIARRISDNPLMPFVAPLMAGLCFPVLYQFYPGRIDHHGLQIVLGLGALLAVLKSGETRRWALIAGLCCGLALWVGIESAPFVAAAIIALSLNWVLGQARNDGALIGFAISFALSTAGLVMISRPSALWGAAHCDALSSVFVLAAGLVAVAILCAVALGRRLKGVWARLFTIGALGVAALALTLIIYPQCLSGPYAALDPRLDALWLDNVQEAYPFHVFLGKDLITASAMISAPLLAALALSVILLGKGRRGVKTLFVSNSAVRAASIFAALAFLTGLIQLRQMTFAGIFAAPLAASLMAYGLTYSARIKTDVKRALVRVAIIAFCTPLALPTFLSVITPAKAQSAQKQDEGQSCLSRAALEDLSALGGGFALTQIDMGTPLLLWTNLSVSSAPYHRNIDGNLAAIDAFSAPPEQAKALIRKLRVDFVISCDVLNESQLIKQMAPDGLLAQLMDGKPPRWLRPVALGEHISKDGPLRVYVLAQ